ncbi:MAG: rhomboid family intramembrane serine protease [Candidatus Omnitrophica bacterium]|nr:rhomboid family intramembrane serine protease [Candidatus Omnitrophota bacterium]
MIPLRDENPSRRVPVMTVLMIMINGYIFIRQVMLGNALPAFIADYAFTPAVYFQPESGNLLHLLAKQIPLVTALFLHGSLFHVLSNMWYLWIFGDNVEDRFGPFGFLVFYLLCGISGNLFHAVMNARSAVPALGASGCISGILGAYFLLFPRARIVTLVPLLFVWTVAEISAFFFLGFWFVLQFLNGFFHLGSKTGAGVAWWAHIGGFLAGAVMMPFFVRRRR